MRRDRDDGGAAARRAVVRWARRLLWRDRRQHLLIVSLLTVAVAASIGFATAAYNIAPSSGRAEFGDADHFFGFEHTDPAKLTATLAAATEWFGAIDPIGHRLVPVPGSTTNLDYRAQQVDGPYGGPMLALTAGRYPSDETEVAVTAGVADELGLDIGGVLDLDGVERTIVGRVENPNDLDDEFALVSPSLLSESDSVKILVKANEDRVLSFRPPGGGDRMIAARGDVPEDVMATLVVLIVTAVAMFLVALVAAAGFVVIAQRRLPQLGLLSAVGATERHIRLTMVASGAVSGIVAAVVGSVLGVGGWLVAAPHIDGAVGFRIDPWHMPWWSVGASAVLAVLTATGAAWWPARAMARVPTVLALSGRPPRPTPVHRSGLLAIGFVAAGIGALRYATKPVVGPQRLGWSHEALIAGGMLAVLVGVLLGGPLAIRVIARFANRTPISTRLALRDLGRYQARSGAALSAISLALGIPIAIVATAAAAENDAGMGNLPSTELIVRMQDFGPFAPTADRTDALQAGADEIAGMLGTEAIRLDTVRDPGLALADERGTVPVIAVASAIEGGWADIGIIYVATPELLADLGIDALDPDIEIHTSATGDVGIVGVGDLRSETRAEVERIADPGDLEPTYAALPAALITAADAAARGWEVMPSGQWLIHLDQPVTTTQLSALRDVASRADLTIETREDPESLASLRAGAVAVGMLLALGVLAMTVGLIRSETGDDLRVLSATGASSSVRRSVTAATAGALAIVGAVLALTAAYLALVAGRLQHLTPLPLRDLATITIGTSLIATLAGWVFAGREPSALARRAIG